ncbi:hypothetical protein LPJ56_003434 [Coemansia sp. RSA 2599]|nr:hypothetical protein LPJ56_003434 [Coemansia sp. RSA 2599]
MSRLPPVRPPPPVPTATAQGYVDDYVPKASASPSTTSSSSSSYDYSFGVALSGYDGSITHYYVSYSDPYVSGAVGVGHTDPTPTPEASKPVEGVVCDKNFPSLLSALHLDLGLRLNLMLIGINACRVTKMTSSELDVKKLGDVCTKIIRNGDLDKLTARSIRREAEEQMGLEERALDKAPYKQMVKDIVSKALEDLADSKEEKQGGSESAAEPGEESEAEAQGDSDRENGYSTDDRDGKDTCAEKNESDNKDEGADSDGNSSGDSDDDSNGDRDNDNDFSGESDRPSAKSTSRIKTKKRTIEATLPKKTKKAKTNSAGSMPLSKSNETTIGNLKTYINKCGMRKVWSKELSGMNATQQVRHLKKLLEDLGMEGRPTLEKCKKIKAKRDLQAELEAIEGDSIVASEDRLSREPARRRRSAVAKPASYRVDYSSEEEEEAGEEAGSGRDSGEESKSEGEGKGKDDESDSGKHASESEEQVGDDSEESEESDAYTEDEGEGEGDSDAEGYGNEEAAAHSNEEAEMASSVEDSE